MRLGPHSSLVCFQPDSDLSTFIVGEENACFFKCILYFEGSRKVSFHNSLALLDPLKRRQADPSHASELTLAPPRTRAPPVLGTNIAWNFDFFQIRVTIGNNSILIYFKS